VSLAGTKLLNQYHFYPTRTFDDLWNLGHIILFLYFIFLVILINPQLKNKSLIFKIAVVFGLTTLIGFGIEFFQQFFMGGEADLKDVIKDYIGAMLAYVFFWSGQKEIFLKRVLMVILVVLLFFEVEPVITTAIDEVESLKDFPVLLDFERESELERFSPASTHIQISNDYSSHGSQSLKIDFTQQLYSTLSLDYFPNNWVDFSYLKFDIFNPGEPLSIICRINDTAHENHDNAYNDRFNKKILLTRGWNDVSIDLNEVVNAPESRNMNMQSIQNWAIFTYKLKERQTLYMDYLRLE